MLPPDFIKRLENIIRPAESLAAVIKSFAQPKYTTFRVNNLRGDTTEILHQLTQIGIKSTPINFFPNIYAIAPEQRVILTGSELIAQGKVYIQNLASMLAVIVLDPQPNEHILDLTAAPGSKTCQIATVMHNQGKIAAVEKSESRFFKLVRNLQTQGVTCARTFLKDGRSIGRLCPARFDRVLLDAPCSSEGRFTLNDPQSAQYWSRKKIQQMAQQQKKLIVSAFDALRPGGILVYSTCTFAPEENEAVICELVEKFPQQTLIGKIELPLTNIQLGLSHWEDKIFPKDLENAIRILPNEYMEGFFICRIKKCV